MLQWIVAETEQAKEDGVRFLCRHEEDLGVPYKWSTIVSSLYTAIYDNGFMIGKDDGGQVRGALAYAFRGAEDGGVDRNRIEVHLLYLEAGIRGGRTLLEAISALVERELDLYEPVAEIGFYCTPSESNGRLYGKIATESGTELHPCGMLSFYSTTPGRLGQYAARHRRASRKKP